MTNGQKYAWAGRIALFCLAALTVTTVCSMFFWPIEGDVLRSTNAVFSSVLTFVLGVFTGATRPDPDAAKNVLASITARADGPEGSVTATAREEKPQDGAGGP